MLLRATLIAATIALLSFAALAHADTGNESQYVSDVQALGVVENPHGILADVSVVISPTSRGRRSFRLRP
jgi:hypothetical protein